MDKIEKKFLVIGVMQSKNNGKYYATGRMWSADKKLWLGSKNKDGAWGDQLVEISVSQHNKLKEKIETCQAVIVEAEVSGYNDFNFPIWALKL